MYLLKLDTSFFSNNSTNTHRRPTKPFVLCSYSPVWHLSFSDLFALLSTLTYLHGRGAKGMISPGYHLDIYEEDWVIFWFYLAETGNGFIQETPIEYHLSTNVSKNEMFVGKGHTHDFSHWCGCWLHSDTYLLSNYQSSRCLI